MKICLYCSNQADSLDKVNPHYRGSAGGRRLEMRAYDTEMGVEVELECLQGQVRQSRQIVVVETSGKTHNLPIPEDMKDPDEHPLSVALGQFQNAPFVHHARGQHRSIPGESDWHR
jgi:hypothetical protein